ncbi:MAG: hypothetical protein AAF846_23695 [Chloroflexota bacterium]
MQRQKPITLKKFLFQWIGLQVFVSIVIICLTAGIVFVLDTFFPSLTSLTLILTIALIVVFFSTSLAQYSAIENFERLQFKHWLKVNCIAFGLSAIWIYVCSTYNFRGFNVYPLEIRELIQYAGLFIFFPIAHGVALWFSQAITSLPKLLVYITLSISVLTLPLYCLFADVLQLVGFFIMLWLLQTLQGVVLWAMLDTPSWDEPAIYRCN